MTTLAVSDRCTLYFETYLLEHVNSPLVLMLNEVERVHARAGTGFSRTSQTQLAIGQPGSRTDGSRWGTSGACTDSALSPLP